MTELRFPAGTFTPEPAPAPRGRTVLAAAGLEIRMLLRNGEQLLLAVLIPLGVLIGLSVTSMFDLDEPRIDTVAPGVFTLAIISTAFTSQAITTGFDRRYGVLKRLAAAGVGRFHLIAGKALACLAVVVGQLVLLGAVALILGWSPVGNVLWVAVLVVLGIAASLGLALLVGGTLRAEAVLAVANLVWLVLIGIGGVVLPLTKSPDWLQVVGEITPAGALSSALREVLQHNEAPSLMHLSVLVAWVILGWAGTVRWFRWH